MIRGIGRWLLELVALALWCSVVFVVAILILTAQFGPPL